MTTKAKSKGAGKEAGSPHTPGPWMIRRGKYGVDILGTGPRGDVAVAAIDRHYTEANARLIAEAPAMYEALRGLLRLREESLCSCSSTADGGRVGRARDILARIEGTSAANALLAAIKTAGRG